MDQGDQTASDVATQDIEAQYERAGHSDRAERLGREAQILHTVLEG